MSLKTQLKDRKPSHRDLKFCMDRPLVAELEAALVLDKKENQTSEAYSGGKSQRVKDLEKKVKASTVTLRFSSVSRSDYYALMEGHPPREGEDEYFNPETFFEALAKLTVEEVTAKGTIPVHDDDWEVFIDGCTDGEYDQIAQTVMLLNRSLLPESLAPLG